ncbi:hypothetical protein GYMLUDRAFT_77698 [Collybiopsis luxurians FD-317 M1]|uniref:Uncharacterized protein n=1 Tax=Collybiopsis luxurians FD-317 M1 TaxID=944289 RepID=A0A0D0CD74_9AGAR|nr:hypothetical protein GYMLUDRAFT_77698 [Collybiopsis luxurians FD-317 M1]
MNHSVSEQLLSGFFYRHHHQLGERGIIHAFPFDSTTRVRHLADYVLEYAGLWFKPAEKFEELKYPKKAPLHIGFFKVDLPIKPIETIQNRVQHWLEQNCEQDQLRSRQEISKLWTDNVDPDSRIQFIVLTLDDLHSRLKNMANISQLPSPSQSAIDPKSCHNVAGGVYDGRPAGFHGLPNALFDSRLAKLEEAMSNLDTIEVDKVYIEFALKLISASIAFYRQDNHRERRLCEIIFDNLFPNGEWLKEIKHGKPEAFWLLSLIFELKNERGVGGDARMQCILDYLKLLNDPNQVCCCGTLVANTDVDGSRHALFEKLLVAHPFCLVWLEPSSIFRQLYTLMRLTSTTFFR